MDIKLIKQLARTMNIEGLKMVKVTTAQGVIELERDCTTEGCIGPVREEPVEKEPKKEVKTLEVRSPISGKFLSYMEGEAPYVTRGSKVKKGDVLCLIEENGELHEVESDCDGTIVKEMLRHGEDIKADQIIFKVKCG